jgi:hypothetical protein
MRHRRHIAPTRDGGGGSSVALEYIKAQNLSMVAGSLMKQLLTGNFGENPAEECCGRGARFLEVFQMTDVNEAADPKPEVPNPVQPEPEVPNPDLPEPEIPKPNIPEPERPRPERPKPEIPEPDPSEPEIFPPDTPPAEPPPPGQPPDIVG